MDVLWDSPKAALTGREVADQLPDRAYTTVLTILDRLRRKGLVNRTTEARAHRFAAADTRASYMAELMIDAMGGAADRGAVLARFAESVSSEEAVYSAVHSTTSPADRSSHRHEPARRGRRPRGHHSHPPRTRQRWLADAAWVTRAPRSAVALWQAIGLSAIASGIGAGLAVAVYRYHAGFAPGVGEAHGRFGRWPSPPGSRTARRPRSDPRRGFADRRVRPLRLC